MVDTSQQTDGRTILVTGQSPAINNHELLEMFFENDRQGGGEIEDIQFDTISNSALITYKDKSESLH